MYRARDLAVSTYASPSRDAWAIPPLVGEWANVPWTAADALAVERYLAHRFDLLGSGWVQVRHGMTCSGFAGRRLGAGAAVSDASPAALVARLPRTARGVARRLRAMLPDTYVPIDWHIDFRSGFRWPENAWYRDVGFGVDGADIKVPWELSRFQHLPEMALAFGRSGEAALAREFQDQVLDWLASNPPRFGPNWASAMDVGIRVANLLIAFDLFTRAGASFHAELPAIVLATARDHARHIVRNLEWSERHRSNHYLGDVSGLLVAAAYLPAGDESDAWLAFAVQELVAECGRQFLEDGAHFEASTSYHRLCAEMLAVAALVARRVPEARWRGMASRSLRMPFGPGLDAAMPRRLLAQWEATGEVFPPAFHERLARAARFTADMTKPDGTVVQLGDNDSGRFVRLGGWVADGTMAEARRRYANLPEQDGLPADAPYVTQRSLDHSQWLGWAAALTDGELLPDAAARPASPPPSRSHAAAPIGVRTAQRVERRMTVSGTDLLDGLRIAAYPDFGAYVFRSGRLHLVVRCGSGMNDGAGVHAHEDHLSVELTLDGVTVAPDPGTYVYTASRASRNAYRGAAVHAAPSLTGPHPRPDAAPFAAPRVRESRCLAFGVHHFEGTVDLEGGSVTRRITLHPDAVEIVDDYALDAGWVVAAHDPFMPAQRIAFSPAYGVRVR